MKNRNSKTQFTIALVLLFTAFTACSPSKPAEKQAKQVEATEQHEHAEEMEEAPTTDTQYASIGKESIDQLLSAYIEIKNALVETNAETAKAKAENLIRGIDSTAESTFSGIIDIANKIADSEGVEDQRVKFEDLSKEVYEVVKVSKASSTVYKQFCPMAFDNKGAFWLSTEKQILNPYFGDKMLKCGKVQETLTSNE